MAELCCSALEALEESEPALRLRSVCSALETVGKAKGREPALKLKAEAEASIS